MGRRNNPLYPALLTLLVLTTYVGLVIWDAGGDPLALARIGTRFSRGDPRGTEGYDGQFVFYIAREPRPDVVAERLDVPAYRYQRILLPLLARLLAAGDESRIPWILAVLGVLSHAAGTWAVAVLLRRLGVSPWYALVYGLWVGLILSVRLDLPEPLAFGLVAAALLAIADEKHEVGWVLYGLALFAKEITGVFAVAQGLTYLWHRQMRRTAGLSVVAFTPFVLFQLWLWHVFGTPGVGSGGAMATPFEWIPLMGMLRIGAYSITYLLAYLVVFGPFLLFPAIWGVWMAGRRALRGEVEHFTIGVILNVAVLFFLPFSTFREPGGLLRFAAGLVLALVLFAARFRYRKALRYLPLMLVLDVFLLKGHVG